MKAKPVSLDGTITYSLYLSQWFKLILFGYLSFFTLAVLGGSVAFFFMAVHSDPAAYIAILWMFLIIGWLWYWILSTPHKILVSPDDNITFVSMLRKNTLNPSEITSIKPEYGQIGFLLVRSSRGKVKLLNQFDQFHEFIGKLKKLNPSIMIRGC